MISGKSFSERCKWVVDPRYPHSGAFQYSKALAGDWVFLNGDILHSFVSRLPYIGFKKFVFIVHNTDRSFGQLELRALLPHMSHVYAINTTIHHPQLTTIPIGFVDKRLDDISHFKIPEYKRTIEIYSNFKVVNNTPKRQDCMNVFKNDDRVTFREDIDFLPYLDDLCRSKFVLCPVGTGLDTHRVYEAILCGAVPVVLRNELTSLYAKLPVCIVDSWSAPFYTPICIPRFDIDYFLN